MHRLALFLVLSLWPLLSAAAADDPADRITARPVHATLYEGAAHMSFRAEVMLDAGANTVTLTGLPEDWRVDQLQVTSLTNEVNVTDVSLQPATRPNETARMTALESAIALIRDDSDILRDQGKRIRTLISILKNSTPPAPDTADAERRWGRMVDTLKNRMQGLQQEQRRIWSKRRALMQRKKALQVERRALPGRIDYQSATVRLNARSGTEAVLSLKGLTRLAGWSLAPRAALDQASSRMTLTVNARLHQKTGRDWRGIPVTLTTAAPDHFLSVPDPGPHLITTPTDRPRPRLMRAEANKADSSDNDLFVMRRTLAEPVTLAHDASLTRPLWQSGIDVETQVRVMPLALDQAILTATGPYDGPAPLPATQITLMRDGLPVGHSRTALITPGSSFTLPFGRIDGITVTSTPIARPDDGAEAPTPEKGADPIMVRERLWRFSVTNRTETALPVRLIAVQPGSDLDNVSITTLPRTTEPDVRNANGVAGRFEWHMTLDPGENRDILFGYGVRHPADMRLTGP
ncbi:DUF4139 domain-containing protein [Yunchengibacter salinarum]|uniref:DUF4139 domain-containing protein n=1 Tax=Yunchengibacter salinarum TaxID=3133399 RepID=UPI0035B596C6